jgi:hypothetical protein
MKPKDIKARLDREGLARLTKTGLLALRDPAIIDCRYARRGRNDVIIAFTSFDFAEIDTRFPFWKNWAKVSCPSVLLMPFKIAGSNFVALDDCRFHRYASGETVFSPVHMDVLQSALSIWGCSPVEIGLVNPDTLELGIEAASDEDATMLRLQAPLTYKRLCEVRDAETMVMRQQHRRLIEALDAKS